MLLYKYLQLGNNYRRNVRVDTSFFCVVVVVVSFVLLLLLLLLLLCAVANRLLYLTNQHLWISLAMHFGTHDPCVQRLPSIYRIESRFADSIDNVCCESAQRLPFKFTYFPFIFTHLPFIFTQFPFKFTHLPFKFTQLPFKFTHLPFKFTQLPFKFTYSLSSEEDAGRELSTSQNRLCMHSLLPTTTVPTEMAAAFVNASAGFVLQKFAKTNYFKCLNWLLIMRILMG